jgi:hypothetical protein
MSWAIGVLKQNSGPSFTGLRGLIPPTARNVPVRIPGGVGATALPWAPWRTEQKPRKFLSGSLDAPLRHIYSNSSANLPDPTVADALALTPNIKGFLPRWDSLIPSLRLPCPLRGLDEHKGDTADPRGTKSPGLKWAASMQKALKIRQVQ